MGELGFRIGLMGVSDSHLHFLGLVHAFQQWCQPFRVITNSMRPLVCPSRGLGRSGGMYPIRDVAIRTSSGRSLPTTVARGGANPFGSSRIRRVRTSPEAYSRHSGRCTSHVMVDGRWIVSLIDRILSWLSRGVLHPDPFLDAYLLHVPPPDRITDDGVPE